MPGYLENTDCREHTHREEVCYSDVLHVPAECQPGRNEEQENSWNAAARELSAMRFS